MKVVEVISTSFLYFRIPVKVEVVISASFFVFSYFCESGGSHLCLFFAYLYCRVHVKVEVVISASFFVFSYICENGSVFVFSYFCESGGSHHYLFLCIFEFL